MLQVFATVLVPRLGLQKRFHKRWGLIWVDWHDWRTAYVFFSDIRSIKQWGSGRFEKTRKAVCEGASTAPVDLRYLRKAKFGSNQQCPILAGVVSFLEGVYNSVAETLPDVRDGPCDEDAGWSNGPICWRWRFVRAGVEEAWWHWQGQAAQTWSGGLPDQDYSKWVWDPILAPGNYEGLLGPVQAGPAIWWACRFVSYILACNFAWLWFWHLFFSLGPWQETSFFLEVLPVSSEVWAAHYSFMKFRKNIVPCTMHGVHQTQILDPTSWTPFKCPKHAAKHAVCTPCKPVCW